MQDSLLYNKIAEAGLLSQCPDGAEGGSEGCVGMGMCPATTEYIFLKLLFKIFIEAKYKTSTFQWSSKTVEI